MSANSENTFRTLAEKPLLATNWVWCKLGFHKWMKFGPAERITRVPPGHTFTCQFLIQYKQCDTCGKIKEHIIYRSG